MIISPSAISPYKIPTFQSGGDPVPAFIDAVAAACNNCGVYQALWIFRNDKAQALQMAQTF
jgi:hypothetical protein